MHDTPGVPTLREVGTGDDILPAYRGTPIEMLLRYHNLGERDSAWDQRQDAEHAENAERR